MRDVELHDHIGIGRGSLCVGGFLVKIVQKELSPVGYSSVAKEPRSFIRVSLPEDHGRIPRNTELDTQSLFFNRIEPSNPKTFVVCEVIPLRENFLTESAPRSIE